MSLSSSVVPADFKMCMAADEVFPYLLILPYPFEPDQPEWAFVDEVRPYGFGHFVGVANLTTDWYALVYGFIYANSLGKVVGMRMSENGALTWGMVRKLYGGMHAR